MQYVIIGNVRFNKNDVKSHTVKDIGYGTKVNYVELQDGTKISFEDQSSSVFANVHRMKYVDKEGNNPEIRTVFENITGLGVEDTENADVYELLNCEQSSVLACKEGGKDKIISNTPISIDYNYTDEIHVKDVKTLTLDEAKDIKYLYQNTRLDQYIENPKVSPDKGLTKKIRNSIQNEKKYYDMQNNEQLKDVVTSIFHDACKTNDDLVDVMTELFDGQIEDIVTNEEHTEMILNLSGNRQCHIRSDFKTQDWPTVEVEVIDLETTCAYSDARNTPKKNLEKDMPKIDKWETSYIEGNKDIPKPLVRMIKKHDIQNNQELLQAVLDVVNFNQTKEDKVDVLETLKKAFGKQISKVEVFTGQSFTITLNDGRRIEYFCPKPNISPSIIIENDNSH